MANSEDPNPKKLENIANNTSGAVNDLIHRTVDVSGNIVKPFQAKANLSEKHLTPLET